MQSISKRLITNYLTISLFTLIILETLFIVAISQYYFGSVERTLISRVDASAAYFSRNDFRVSSDEKITIYDRSKFIFENMDSEERALIEVVDLEGKVVIDNTGASSEEEISTPDYLQALNGRAESWRGKSEAGEAIIAASAPIYNNKEIIGVLRYQSSLEKVNQIVYQYVVFVVGIGIVVLAASAFFGYVMARRILIPIKDLIRVTGEIAQGNFKVSAIKYHNDEIGQLVDAFNIMAKEITKSDQAKNEFISSISHELRTPLTSIKGWGETILDAIDDHETTEEGLNIICRETDRLIVLVNDLLDFSKLQAQRLELHKEEFHLDKLLNDIKNQFIIRTKQEKVKLSLQENDDGVLILADYNRMKQVLINIIDNAMKFTIGRPNAEIKIISCIVEEQLAIIIEDNGSGISAEDLAMVKEKFYKGTSKKSGTGLGLSIASEIVELHGGELMIDSIVGEGTKVVIILPLYYEMPIEE